MKFKVSCDLGYQLSSPATFLFALRCLHTSGQQILSESLSTNPDLEIEEFHIVSGMNRFSRMKTINPGNIDINYEAVLDISHRIVSQNEIYSQPTGELNPEGIPFLFPSRYCQSDIMRQQANDMFGHIQGAYNIASAVSDWVYHNIAYVSGSSGETSSAVDTMQDRQGVCRDFAHLAITLCRALNVPARYVTAYAYKLDPPDFHACFEVFIDGWWYIFDTTRMAPLNGLVRIATGRDAADAAVCTIFGDPILTRTNVRCEVMDSNFSAITRDDLARTDEAIMLL